MTINEAIEKVAQAEAWTFRTNHELGLLLWALFRFEIIKFVNDMNRGNKNYTPYGVGLETKENEDEKK